VEVWDFDPAETVKEKVTKVGDIKGFKGMRRFMKEIAVTATNGKHDNEIIGGTLIPLKVTRRVCRRMLIVSIRFITTPCDFYSFVFIRLFSRLRYCNGRRRYLLGARPPGTIWRRKARANRKATCC